MWSAVPILDTHATACTFAKGRHKRWCLAWSLETYWGHFVCLKCWIAKINSVRSAVSFMNLNKCAITYMYEMIVFVYLQATQKTEA